MTAPVAATAPTAATTPGMRRILWIAGLLVLAQSLPLTLLTTRTDRFFAWTIDVPLTAAFLGAGYAAATVLEIVAARQAAWARTRTAVPGVLVFTTLTLLVTLLHLDRFHLADVDLLTRTVTWAWLVIYVVVPPALALTWWRQSRTGGGPVPADVPGRTLPTALRHGLGLQGLVMGVLGLLLLVLPADGARLWPWPLTVLTAQAVGAWLVGLAVLALDLWRADRLGAGVAALPACLLLAVLQLVAVARFRATLEWGDLATWLYLAFLLSLGAVGVAGSAALWRPASGVGPGLPSHP